MCESFFVAPGTKKKKKQKKNEDGPRRRTKTGRGEEGRNSQVVKKGDLTMPKIEWKISTMAVVCTTLSGKSTA